MGYDISLSLVHVYLRIALETILIEVRTLLFRNHADTNFHNIFGLHWRVKQRNISLLSLSCWAEETAKL